MNVRHLLVGTGLGALAIAAAAAQAQSGTETYGYDALGRLITVVTSGGQNNAETQSICYDDAGNRTQYVSDTSGVAVDCSTVAPPPPPPPPPPPTGPSFAIGNASGLEGNVLVFTVTKTGTTTESFTVNFATASGSAGSTDYVATSGTLTFTSTQTTRTISVTTNADIKVEGNETFFVNLSGASGTATISDSQGLGTIFNDEGNCPLC